MKKYFLKNESSNHFFYMLWFSCLLLLSLPFDSNAQKKKTPPPEDVTHIVSYEILENGDTINRLDNKNRKEGKWLIVNKGGYGEEDFIELGTYDHNIKMGTWKSYTMNGVIISQEYYKQGNKSGEAKYYDDGLLYCVGNYLALSSLYDYDTIMVEDPITNIEKPVIIKTDVGSVRHGFWTYYDPPSKEVKKVVEYQADEVIYEKEYTAKADSVYIKEKMKSFSKGNTNANQMILEKNKKPSKFTDIPDNAEYVKPNVKKKR